MKLIATKLNFDNLTSLDTIVNGLQPEVKLENLNAYLNYNKLSSELSFFIKGPQGYGRIKIQSEIETDATTDITFMVYTSNIVHLLSTYTEVEKESLIMTLGVDGEKSNFGFTSDKDTVNFAHLLMKDTDIDEIKGLIKILDEGQSETVLLDSSTLNDDATYFYDGINNAIGFIEDEAKNNAIAIYADRIISNDNRHVYVYDFINKIKVTNPVHLHRKIAKVILDLYGKKGIMTFTVLEKKVLISDPKYGFTCVMNNAMANVVPPTDEDIVNLSPVTLVTTIVKTDISDLIKFFLGFYSKKVNYKTITIEIKEDGLNFVLRNTGVSGFNSSHVERKFNTEIHDSVNVTSMVVITSIQSFVSNLNKEDTIDVYMDSTHRAVVLKSLRQSILLPKLT